ncbi:hypothetical protein NESM_000648600 [Novymonas esmeraldas]|uniref:Uncharacterized protein n=1 Tax=Novymonas esmeraldas TaxID=1808958 RepID=A0AAW0EU48_9TRYP
MTSNDDVFVHAAEELDGILNAGAGMYLHRIRTPGAPPLRAALGFSLQPMDSGLVVCLADVSDAAEGAAGYTDFPVLVDRRVAAATRAFFVRSFECAHSATPDSAGNEGTRRDSLDSTPHVTRAALRDMSPEHVALAWACAPQVDLFALLRRGWLRDTCFATCAPASRHNILRRVVKEYVLLDLFLSLCPKLKSLWEYRHWLCSRMHAHGFFAETLADINEAALPIAPFVTQDDELFFICAHNHPLNYNAWHYRRQRLHLLHTNSWESGARRDLAHAVVLADSKAVTHFVREHNGDSSATSYLLFLLHEQDALDEKAHPSHHIAGEAMQEDGVGTRASQLWRTLMALTQTEIRWHSEKGHECMWHLRLGLVQWACTRPPERSVRSQWTIADELTWTAAYADLHLVDGTNNRLSPVGVLPHPWTECSGSPAWTSYSAARYGCRLCAFLSGASTHGRQN